MLNTAGAFLICFVCAAYGFSRAAKLSRRVRLLREFIGAAELCRLEIGRKLTPLPDLLALLTRERTGLSRFWELVSELWDKSGYLGFSSAWREALVSLELASEDREVLEETGGILGRYDADSQAQGLERVIHALERQMESARSESVLSGRLYRTLGLAAGLAALIFLL